MKQRQRPTGEGAVPEHQSSTIGGDSDPKTPPRTAKTKRELELDAREHALDAREGRLEPKYFRYRLKRECYWGDGVDARLWRDHDSPEKDGVFTIDVNRMGTPPHHFEPIDGGPVGVAPTRSIFYDADYRAPSHDTAPETLSEHAFSPKPAEPLGLPKPS